MTNYDDDVLGINNSQHPANYEETESEFELLREELNSEALRIIDEELGSLEGKILALKSKNVQLLGLVKEIEALEDMKQFNGLEPYEELKIKQYTERLFNLIKSL